MMDTKRGAGLVSLFVLVLLIFSLSPKVQAQGVVSVSIDPQERRAKVGTGCTFNVTVNNAGRGADNFSLEASDNLGWGLMFSENLLEVPENGHGTATFTVTIPENVELYTEDNILVIATSQREPTIISRASCKVVAVSLGVKLFISPPENIQPPGEIATFEVTVQNIGKVIDNYRLKAKESQSTGQSWKPTFGENFFEGVAPGENRTTTLTMTVPREGIEQGDYSVVTVTVTSQTDSNIYDVSHCTAKTPMETNWNYFYTGIGIVVVAGVIVVVLWKGPLAGG
jgi:uncharacterized membrane protein